jgi:hypothetical protein
MTVDIIVSATCSLIEEETCGGGESTDSHGNGEELLE